MRRRFLRSLTQDPKPVVAPRTVDEGGVLVIEVNSNAKELGLLVPGVGAIYLPVPHSRRVEYRLPPEVHGGDGIVITDLNWPTPGGATVLVVGA